MVEGDKDDINSRMNGLEDSFEIVETQYDHVTSFEELNLEESLLHGISSIGYHTPSPIQRKAIKPALDHRDVIAQAQSGTGKTAAFVISVLRLIDMKVPYVQAIVLAPTRELAKQIQSVFTIIGGNMNLRSRAFIGGINLKSDIDFISGGIHVAIGTPGRVFHIISEGKINVGSVKIFVLDEADEMLSAGFAEQIYNIYTSLPRGMQSLLYSATLSEDTLDLSRKFMKDPVTILMKKEKLTLQGIRQFFVSVDTIELKVVTVLDLCNSISSSQVVVFAGSPHYVEMIYSKMIENSFSVGRIHGGIDQFDREDIMRQFRNNELRTLVATDLIARGIDVQNVSMVINFDMPKNADIYLHRIGRSGRFGKTGKAINIVTPDQMGFIKDIENYFETSINELRAVDVERNV